ncbi:hypothetical protein TorRG33x02_247740, partial [Trema orientale]
AAGPNWHHSVRTSRKLVPPVPRHGTATLYTVVVWRHSAMPVALQYFFVAPWHCPLGFGSPQCQPHDRFDAAAPNFGVAELKSIEQLAKFLDRDLLPLVFSLA